VRFVFRGIHYDGAIASRWDMLLRIVGDFSVTIDSRVLYAEVEFCLVELAVQLGHWLGKLQEAPLDFSYDSMESDQAGLISITRVGEDAWKIAAAHEEYDEERCFSTAEVTRAASEFCRALRAALEPEVDILDLFDEGARAVFVAN
jgi:hypothetical protein